MERNLIKEQSINRKRKTRKVYGITELGLTALKNVKEINNALHVFDELEKPRIDLSLQNVGIPF
jgi:DNA-binding PadR family transcriptional regulator